MAKKKDSHEAVRFQVLGPGGEAETFHSLDKAAAFVFREALHGGKWSNLSVLVLTEAGARWWAGEQGAELYRANPNAQVFDQIAIKVQPQGMIV